MNLLKSSILHEYLYSPKTWLHKQNIYSKVYFVLVILVYLPYIKILYILFFLFIAFFAYNSFYKPKELSLYLSRIVTIFFILLTISIENQQQFIQGTMQSRRYIKIYPILTTNINLVDTDNYLKYFLFCKYNDAYYLPTSLFRLLVINFLYLLLMKILLLTTIYQKIIKCFLNFTYGQAINTVQKISFEIQTSIQFLNIIFNEIKIIKIAYNTRNVQIQSFKSFQQYLHLYFACIHQLLINIYTYTQDISISLYYYSIDKKNLNILY